MAWNCDNNPMYAATVLWRKRHKKKERGGIRPQQRRRTMPRRPTKDPHTRPAINTLERLHRELGGQILENRQRHDELSHQMRHVEAVIKMLDPGYNLARI